MASTAPSDVRTSAPTVKALIESSMVPDRRNTHNLPRRIASDLTAAFCASTLVAQIITIIDKQVPSPQSSLTIHPETSVLQSHQLTPLPPARSIILRTSTPTPLPILLRSSIRIAVSSPHHFLISPPALLVTLLYFGTYTTANLTDTITSTITALPASTVSAGPAKFLATTATNMSLCLYKDAQFARMFGSHSSTSTLKKVVPKTALALFALRDSLTVFASFNVPPLLAPVLGSQNAAQFLAPAGVQIFSTPVHLLGLDLYNRSGREVGWGDRWRRIRRDWAGAALARMGRVVPAFGVGGVVNGRVRAWLMQWL